MGPPNLQNFENERDIYNENKKFCGKKYEV